MATEEGEAPPPPPQVELNVRELTAGLFAACKMGRVSAVARLLDMGAPATAEDARGWAPLHWASFYGHHEVVDVLLKANAGEAYREDVSAAMLGTVGSPGGGGLGSPMPSGGTTPGAPPAPGSARAVNVVHSPLHTAISRGHLRCVWALLAAGCSASDVDNQGNTALHLAAAASPPSPSVRLELLTSVMYAGFDASARNWQGFTAQDMLPKGEAAAQRLLARAHAALQCASTGVPFVGDTLRYLCASTGGFYSEAASSPAIFHAFAAAVPGVTLPCAGAPGSAAPLPPPVTDGMRYGWVTCNSVPLAVWAGDLAILRPVRLGTETCSKVGDAELALLAAANPMAGAVEEARARRAQAARAAAEAAAAVAEAGAAEAEAEAEAGTASVPPSSAPQPQEGAAPSADPPTTASAPAPTPMRAGISAAMHLSPDMPPSQAFDSESMGGSPVPRLPLHVRGGFSSEEVVGLGGAAAAAAAAAASHAHPCDLYITPEHRGALEAALAGGRDTACDVQVLATALALSARLAAVGRAVASAGDLAAARPLDTRSHPTLSRLDAALQEVRVYGCGKALEGLLLLSPSLAIAELELGNALAVAQRVPLATHAHDAVIARLGGALARAQGLAALAQRACSGEEADAVTAADITAAGSAQAAAAAAAAQPMAEVLRLGIPSALGAAPPLPPLPQSLLEECAVLHKRLVAEVMISDVVAAGERAGRAVGEAAAAHAGEDPLALPVPPLPPPTPEALAAAAAAAAAAPAGKGGGAKAPPPAPAKAGGKAPPPPVEPPPHPPVDAAFPCDAAGTPLPHTPQLLSLFALRDTLGELGRAASTGAAAGADSASVEAALGAERRLRAALAEGLLAECVRVEEARKKKGKKAPAKKK